MFDLPLISINSMGVRYGASKLFQILIPLASYLLVRDLLIERILLRPAIREKLLKKLPAGPRWQSIRKNFPTIFEQTIGFAAWKIGCDLGFFLIVTGLGPWQRAFTWSGLLPYTVIQYFVYYLLGRKMLIEGQLNPFGSKSAPQPAAERPPGWQRIASKYLHEDLNATSEDIPMRQVLLKPLVDYVGLILSWSMYTVGIFFAQSKELNLAPLVHFAFFQMLTFYLVNTYGYIIGFNIGEWIHFRLSWLEEQYSAWARQQSVDLAQHENPVNASQYIYRLIDALDGYWRELKYRFLWRLTPVTERYGLNRRWLLSAIGGVYCVVLVAPSWSGWMLSMGTQVNRAWFSAFGHLNQVQLAQVSTPPVQTAHLPDSGEIIVGFPAFWQALYEPDAIANNPPEILQEYGIDLSTTLASQAVLSEPDQTGT
ncbi:MAG: hypothetical protein F6K11_22915 [Leptolyngbya sp. SIO3F4]|nr:hypothetical protein [Leptolyngbya sp. SIO3F4]